MYTASADTADPASSEAPPVYAMPTKAGAPSIASAPSPAVSDMPLPPAQPMYATPDRADVATGVSETAAFVKAVASASGSAASASARPLPPAQPMYATPDRADVATGAWETAAFAKAAASAAGTKHQRRDDGDDQGADDGTADAGNDGHHASTVGTADDDDTGNDNDSDGDGDGESDDFGDLEGGFLFRESACRSRMQNFGCGCTRRAEVAVVAVAAVVSGRGLDGRTRVVGRPPLCHVCHLCTGHPLRLFSKS